MRINPWKCCSTALWIKTMHKFYWFQQHQNFTCCLSHSKTCHAWLWELKHHHPSDSGTDDNVTRLVAYCFSSCVPVPLPLLCTLKYWIFHSYSLTKVGQEEGTSLLSSTVHTDGRKSVNISLLSCYSQSYLLRCFSDPVLCKEMSEISNVGLYLGGMQKFQLFGNLSRKIGVFVTLLELLVRIALW